jgi:hypothetical protein
MNVVIQNIRLNPLHYTFAKNVNVTNVLQKEFKTAVVMKEVVFILHAYSVVINGLEDKLKNEIIIFFILLKRSKS